MSGTKLPGHDEFVDLLKSQTNLSRDTEWRGRRRSQLLETIPDPYQDSLHDILVHTRDEQIEHDNSKGEEAHTRILASLVPDEILEFIDDLSIRPYESAFLFGDISGKYKHHSPTFISVNVLRSPKICTLLLRRFKDDIHKISG